MFLVSLIFKIQGTHYCLTEEMTRYRHHYAYSTEEEFIQYDRILHNCLKVLDEITDEYTCEY